MAGTTAEKMEKKAPMEKKMPMEKKAPPTTGTATGGETDPKLLSLLAYIFGALGGLIVFLITKDKFAKFHAMQSLILGIISFVIFVVGSFFCVLGVLGFIPWIYGIYIGIVYAYKGKMYKAPYIGEYAEKYSQ